MLVIKLRPLDTVTFDGTTTLCIEAVEQWSVRLLLTSPTVGRVGVRCRLDESVFFEVLIDDKPVKVTVKMLHLPRSRRYVRLGVATEQFVRVTWKKTEGALC